MSSIYRDMYEGYKEYADCIHEFLENKEKLTKEQCINQLYNFMNRLNYDYENFRREFEGD